MHESQKTNPGVLGQYPSGFAGFLAVLKAPFRLYALQKRVNALQSDNDRLRSEAAAGIAETMQLRALEIREGRIEAEIVTDMMIVVAEAMSYFFREHGGDNSASAELRAVNGSGEVYEMIVKPQTGKMPAQLAAEMKADNARLLQQVEALQKHLQILNEHEPDAVRTLLELCRFGAPNDAFKAARALQIFMETCELPDD